jgi:hypothetical protein
VSIPSFPECSHSLVKSLVSYSDRDLVMQFQRYPDSGQYFIALFCRYSPMVYTLVRHSARSPVQADYLFATTWRHIFHELGGLDLRSMGEAEPGATLQSWLINVTAVCINRSEMPPVEAIHYNLQAASPPFWCYIEQALDRFPPDLRLIVLMARTFNWSETRISAYLQAEGEVISPAEVRSKLEAGYRLLETMLPDDVREIYLVGKPESDRAPSSVHPAAIE